MSNKKGLVSFFAEIGSVSTDSQELKLRKQLLNGLASLMSIGGLMWGGLCAYFDLPWSAAIPFSYTIASIFNLIYFHYSKNFRFVRFFQVLISLLLPFFLQWSLGGFVASGAVMLWALLSLTASMSFQNVKDSRLWLVSYVALIAFSGYFDSYFASDVSIEPKFVTLLFVLNLSMISAMVVVLIMYFINSKNAAADELKELAQSLEDKVSERTEELSQQKKAIEKSYESLNTLNSIGQQITSKLDSGTIAETTYDAINFLMDANGLYIGLYNEANKELQYSGAIKNSTILKSASVSVENVDFACIKSFSQDKIIYIPNCEKEKVCPVFHTNHNASFIHIPLKSQQGVTGLISVQSSKIDAYTEYHINMLKNIATYVSIALENAKSFEKIEDQKAEITKSYKVLSKQREKLEQTITHLRDAQSQIIESEKMASLGQLISGIAHEINTPLGAIRASAQNIDDSLSTAVRELPEILNKLDLEKKELFYELISGDDNRKPLTSREERKAKRKMIREIEEYDVEEADLIADALVDMKIFEVDKYISLFKEPNATQIVDTAYHFSTMKGDSKNITIAVKRASKIVFALKKYIHGGTDEAMEFADITDNIETVLTLYNNQIKQGVELVRTFEAIPNAKCHVDELNQVWTNLLHNSLQAMEYKGKVEFIIKNEEIALKSGLVTPAVSVAIKDNGSGIPEDIRKRIFDPFFTTKKQGEGTGLGLDIVKKIVEKHGGTIIVESEVGVGTTFKVTIPVNIDIEN